MVSLLMGVSSLSWQKILKVGSGSCEMHESGRVGVWGMGWGVAGGVQYCTALPN